MHTLTDDVPGAALIVDATIIGGADHGDGDGDEDQGDAAPSASPR